MQFTTGAIAKLSICAIALLAAHLGGRTVLAQTGSLAGAMLAP